MTEQTAIEDHLKAALRLVRREDYPEALHDLALAFAKMKSASDAKILRPGPVSSRRP
jgi:hypothetical protein